MKQLWEGAAPRRLRAPWAETTSEQLLQPRLPRARPPLVGSKHSLKSTACFNPRLAAGGSARQPSPERARGGKSKLFMRNNPTAVPLLGWQNSRGSGAEPGDRVGKGVPSKGDSTPSPSWQGFQRQGLEISCLQLLPRWVFSHLTILHQAQAHSSLNFLWISYIYSGLVTWVCPLYTFHKGPRLLCCMVSLSTGQMSVLLAKIQFVTDCWCERHVKEHLSLPCGYPASIIPPP